MDFLGPVCCFRCWFFSGKQSQVHLEIKFYWLKGHPFNESDWHKKISHHMIIIFIIESKQKKKSRLCGCLVKKFYYLFKTTKKSFLWKNHHKITLAFRTPPRSLDPSSSGSDELLMQQFAGSDCSGGCMSWTCITPDLLLFIISKQAT